MRAVLRNTGTAILAGEVHDTHLAFIAGEIFSVGLGIEERRTVGDGPAIGETLQNLFPRAEIIFVTGGLGPTSDDITRDVAAELLGLELCEDAGLIESLTKRLEARRFKWDTSSARQSQVTDAPQILPYANGNPPGFYLKYD